jgi:hypothetical protein
MMHRKRAWQFSSALALCCLAVLDAQSVAVAQKKSNPADPGQAFEGMLQCRTIEDSAARLACFDRQVEAFAAAQKSGEVIVAERKVVEEARRAAFGLGVADSSLLRGPDGEPLKSLSAKVKALRPLPGSGRLIISLDDNSKWEQTDPPSYVFAPREGQTLIIERSSLGGYRAKVEGRTGMTRVRRVE